MMEKPYFKFTKPSKEEKERLEAVLRNGIPNNMIVIKLKEDGTSRVVTNDTGRD